MRKYNKYVVAGLLLSLLSFSTYAATEEDSNFSTNTVSEYDNGDGDFSATATEHNNDFCIAGNWDQVTFSKITKSDIESYSVTKGQPFSGIDPNKQPLKKTCIRIRAGRKSGNKPLSWASKQALTPFVQSYDNLFDAFALGTSGANFAVTGTMKLTNKRYKTFKCSNVVVGQAWGYSYCVGDPDVNYWFMSSGTCTNAQGEQVYLKVSAGTSATCATNHNIFEITASKTQ